MQGGGSPFEFDLGKLGQVGAQLLEGLQLSSEELAFGPEMLQAFGLDENKMEEATAKLLQSNFISMIGSLETYTPGKKAILLFQLTTAERALKHASPSLLCHILPWIEAFGDILNGEDPDRQVNHAFIKFCERASTRLFIALSLKRPKKEHPEEQKLWHTRLRALAQFRRIASQTLPDEEEIHERIHFYSANQPDPKAKTVALLYPSLSQSLADQHVRFTMTRVEGAPGRTMELTLKLAPATAEILTPTFATFATDTPTQKAFEAAFNSSFTFGVEGKGESSSLFWKAKGMGTLIASLSSQESGGPRRITSLKLLPEAPPTPAQRWLPMPEQWKKVHQLLSLVALSESLIPAPRPPNPQEQTEK